jgi:hypothetical protein
MRRGSRDPFDPRTSHRVDGIDRGEFCERCGIDGIDRGEFCERCGIDGIDRGELRERCGTDGIDRGELRKRRGVDGRRRERKSYWCASRSRSICCRGSSGD